MSFNPIYPYAYKKKECNMVMNRPLPPLNIKVDLLQKIFQKIK